MNTILGVAMMTMLVGNISIDNVAVKVGEICGARIDPIPTVRHLSAAEYERTYRCRLLADTEEADVNCKIHDHPIAYDYTNNEIIWNKEAHEEEKLADNTSEIEHYRELFIAHELAHVWQFQHISGIREGRYAHSEIAHVLREGHAQFVVAKYARDEGLSYLWNKVVEQLEQMDKVRANQMRENLYFAYVETQRFLEVMENQQPSRGIADIFASRLPTERQIVYPEEYLAKDEVVADQIFSDIEGMVDSMRWTVTGTKRIGYVALRGLLRDIAPDVNRNMRDYLDGVRVNAKEGMVTCVRFSTVKSASDVFNALYREQCEREKEPIDRKRSGPVQYTVHVEKKRRLSGKVLLIVNKDVCEIELPGNTAGERAIELLHAIIKSYTSKEESDAWAMY